MRVQVIDDELHSLQLMEHLLGEVEGISEVKLSQGAQQGILDLHDYKPDLLFLDIHMPHLDGFEVLQSVQDRSFGVVFITAYNQHAIRAFKVNALDYILKPVTSVDLKASIKRFRSYAYKVQAQQVTVFKKQLQSQSEAISKLAIKTLKGIRYIDLNRILFFESSGSMCYAHLEDGDALLVNMLLKDVEDLTMHASFFRAHRRYLVNVSKVREVVTSDSPVAIMLDGSRVLVSRRRKTQFLKLMSSCD